MLRATSPERIAQSLTSLDDDVRKELAQLPSNDWIFAQVLKGTPVVLGQSGVSQRRSHAALTPGLDAWAEVLEIIGVRTVDDR